MLRVPKFASRHVLVLGGALLVCALPLGSQVQMSSSPGRSVRLLGSDQMILDLREARSDLPCAVTFEKPMLGFDLRFHAFYRATLPMRELAGSENQLTVIFRVTPERGKGEPVYFFQRMRVPAIEESAKGETVVEGQFDVGEGAYSVEWLMRDRTDRVCASFWDFEASLSPKDRGLEMTLGPNEVAAAQTEFFAEEPPVQRDPSTSLSVKILINFSPQLDSKAAMYSADTGALVSILRSLAREPQFGRFTVVAFNLREQKVFYRQDNADKIDFPALGDAFSKLRFGTIDYKLLAQKGSESAFLAGLMQEEFGGGASTDALVFSGPKTLLEQRVPEEALRQLGQPNFPVFYMNYNLYPHQVPWRDAIGHAVRYLRGVEYTITRPQDILAAVHEVVSKSFAFRNLRQSGVNSQ